MLRASITKNRILCGTSSTTRLSGTALRHVRLYSNDDISNPSSLAKSSNLPKIEQQLLKKPARQPKKKSPFLSSHAIENDPNYKMNSFLQSFGQSLIKIFNIDMDKSRAGPIAGSKYYGECKKQALYYPNEPLSESAKFYYETLNLPQSFSQWFQITALHYWILSVRMRALPFKYYRAYQQKLVDRFFRDMELRMSEEMGISSNRIIEGYLKEFNTQLLGSVLSYDEGLMTDDITLAAALWRNIFNGNPNADMRHIEALLGHVRQQLYVLNKMSDRQFGFGDFKFVEPNEVVKPLTKAQEVELRAAVKRNYENMDLPSQRSVLSLNE
ncbi:protein Cbp3p, mitochondrial [[Candida] railenensis]|uniref:Protein Cbp3p, mitochondrial n=1 Tax=[Candida] railenensis TaxID=45579 RepID=A0A9P0QLC2_9ASCO|nr:protein Cbp3p, mitochondrial [[Candida] railenensis]